MARPQLGVITNSRTGIKPMKELFGMIDGKGVDHFFQRFRIQAVRIGCAQASTSLATSISPWTIRT